MLSYAMGEGQELGGTLAQDDDEQCQASIVVHPKPG